MPGYDHVLPWRLYVQISRHYSFIDSNKGTYSAYGGQTSTSARAKCLEWQCGISAIPVLLGDIVSSATAQLALQSFIALCLRWVLSQAPKAYYAPPEPHSSWTGALILNPSEARPGNRHEVAPAKRGHESDD